MKKITRRDLLKSKEYWMVQMENDLYSIVQNYMNEVGINQSELANQLLVTKGYISQILNVRADHKLSKLVELSLFCNKIPLISFVDADTYIKADGEGKTYEMRPIIRSRAFQNRQGLSMASGEEAVVKLGRKKRIGKKVRA